MQNSRTSSAGSRGTYGAVLHPWAAKLTLKSHLSAITLANIMAGDTCEPISLSDFEAYLAFREHALQNLQFIVWFQDYRKRFFALPEADQAMSPTFKLTEGTSSAGSQRRSDIDVPILPTSIDQVLSGAPAENSHPISGVYPPEPAWTLPFSSSRTLAQPDAEPPPSPTSAVESPRVGRTRQPFRQECMRIIATFLQLDSPKDLRISDEVRKTVIAQLASSTHPDIFLPVYRETYERLENQCVPRFLAHNTTMYNLPQQIFWYRIAITVILVGVAVSLAIIFTVHASPQSRRAWRVFGVPFVAIGTMQLYAASRGFCGCLWLRGRAQLRVWELQEADEEANNVIFGPNDSMEQNLVRHWDPTTNEYVPFTDTGQDIDVFVVASRSPSRSSNESSLPRREPTWSFKVPVSPTRNGFFRPPVFGPDKIVQDPRIKAVHCQIVKEMIMIGALSASLFSAIVLSVPGPPHR